MQRHAEACFCSPAGLGNEGCGAAPALATNLQTIQITCSNPVPLPTSTRRRVTCGNAQQLGCGWCDVQHAAPAGSSKHGSTVQRYHRTAHPTTCSPSFMHTTMLPRGGLPGSGCTMLFCIARRKAQQRRSGRGSAPGAERHGAPLCSSGERGRQLCMCVMSDDASEARRTHTRYLEQHDHVLPVPLLQSIHQQLHSTLRILLVSPLRLCHALRRAGGAEGRGGGRGGR